MAGRVVILNGAPRSGKTSLARAIQARVPGHWINWGVDAFNATLPPELLPGIGLRPGGELPELEPAVLRLYDAYFQALTGLVQNGFDVVADLGLHSDYAAPFDPMTVLNRHLSDRSVLLVGIRCSIDIIMARRNADPQGGFYVGGDRAPAPVLRWQAQVHNGKNYDLELDTGVLSPEQGAALITSCLLAL